ncbi:hypothetical protein ACJA28_01630 [Mesomycoplasma moatsii]|uniref:hypothetical protein n=1 Tax=Mesomycoplasma moatsii TaxID=171287 RepID=UPI0003B3C7EC
MYQIPKWWEITFGIVLILLGISLFFLQKKSKENVNYYRKRQLEEYRKQNPKFKGNYEDAKLILPWSQRVKLLMWPIIGLSLIIIGIFFSTGFMFSFFIR